MFCVNNVVYFCKLDEKLFALWSWVGNNASPYCGSKCGTVGRRRDIMKVLTWYHTPKQLQLLTPPQFSFGSLFHCTAEQCLSLLALPALMIFHTGTCHGVSGFIVGFDEVTVQLFCESLNSWRLPPEVWPANQPPFPAFLMCPQYACIPHPVPLV